MGKAASFFNKKKLFAATISSIALLTVIPNALAQTPEAAAITREISIPASPLNRSVLAISEQFDVDVLVPNNLVRGKNAPAISGALTAQQALDQALAGSGLVANVAEDGAFVIAEEPAEPEQARRAAGRSQQIEEITVYGVNFEEEGLLEITTDDINRLMANTVDELFRDTPNVEALQGPGRQFFDFNMRGSEGAGNVVVSVDGIEKNMVQTKHGTTFNPVFLVPDFLKSVNLIRGPVSNTFGTGSVGGRVHFENVDPFDYLDGAERFGGSLRAGGEDNGNGRLLTGIGAGKISENLGFLLGVSSREFDSYEDGGGNEVLNSGSDSLNFLAKTQWTPAPGWDVEASFSESEIEYVGSNIFAQSNIRQDADFLNEVVDRGSQIAVDYRPRGTLHVHGGLFHSATGHRETLLESRRGAGGDPGDLDDRDAESFGGQAYVSTVLNSGLIRHDVTFGVSGTRDELEYVGDSSDIGGDRIGYGVFVQDRIAATDSLVLIPGLRYERFDVSTEQGAESTGGEWLPKLTANYSLTDELVLTASYADGLRAPRLNELILGSVSERTRRGATTVTVRLPSEGIEAETSRNFEMGMQLQLPILDTAGFSGGLTLFRNEFSNRIDNVLISSVVEGDTTTNTSQLQNVGEAWIQGIESRLAFDFGAIDFSANLAYTEGEREDTGAELNSVRPARGTLLLGWESVDGRLRLQAEMEGFADKDEIGENDNVVGNSSESEAIGNLFAQYRFSDSSYMSLRVNNVADANYRRFDQIDPSIGRTIRLEIGLQF